MAASDSSTSNGSDGLKLSEIFDNVWKVWEYVENTNENTVSDTFQRRLKEGVAAAESAVVMVNELRLFMDNEELDEVASNEIRYMLLPALLGYLQMKVTSEDRKTVIKKARLFYTDYLHMCKNYNVTDLNHVDIPLIPGPDDTIDTQTTARRPGPPDLKALNAKRQNKIERFKQQKETEKHLQELKPLVEREHVDDEVKRDYYITLLKRWISTSLEELHAMPEELEILEHMANLKSSGSPPPKPVKRDASNPGFRSFILTKSDLQKKVYGAGYPSLPTYTVEEFFDQQMALGNIPQPGSMPGGMPGGMPGEPGQQEEREEEEKERKEEEDDEETLQKARSWDDWKDDHRRGWGNTQNKG